MSLIGINRMALKISPEALEIDKTLRKKALMIMLAWSHSEKSYQTRKMVEKAEVKEKTAGSWNDRLEKMRAKHPNAYRP